MARKTAPKAKAAAPKTDTPKAEAPKGGPTSGVMAPGAVGKAARAAAKGAEPGAPTGWRDPNAKYAESDDSIDARMWRLSQSRDKAWTE